MVWVSIMSLERLTFFGFSGFRIPFCLIEPSSDPLEGNPKLPPPPPHFCGLGFRGWGPLRAASSR